ncbi:MAG: hypothetical protein LBV17_10605 [Treponema sp.]|jgi:hypothetical protein|nr:hypothetical protein [Treponema sp.]
MCSEIRDTLWRDIELELEKNTDLIDTDYIDRRINELCELEARRSGLRPPRTGEFQIKAVINRITARFRRKMPVKRLRNVIRLATVACIALIIAFFPINYVYTRVTNRCLPKKIGITICCGTDYCICSPNKEQTGH